MKNPWRELSMVNPQKEDGHREINNDCYHALMVARLSGAIYQIVLTVIDKTWGFGKHGAPISLGEFQKVTGLSRQSVCLAIKDAEQLRLIVVSRNSTKVSEYMFNKHWDTWLTSQAKHTSKGKELVKQITPDRSSKSHQSSQVKHTSTSQVATPGTVPVKKVLKKTIKKSLKKEAPKKKRYGEFNNVLVTDEEYQKLEDKFGANVPDMVETLSSGIESKGYKYQSHYAAILSWERRERKKGGQDGTHRGHSKQASTEELKASIGRPLD